MKQRCRLDVQGVGDVEDAVKADRVASVLDVDVEAAIQVGTVGDLFLRHVRVQPQLPEAIREDDASRVWGSRFAWHTAKLGAPRGEVCRIFPT